MRALLCARPGELHAHRAARARGRAALGAGAAAPGRRLRHRSAYFRGNAALFRLSPRDRPRTFRRGRGGRRGRAGFRSASALRSSPISIAATASPAGAARPIAARRSTSSASTATAAWRIISAFPTTISSTRAASASTRPRWSNSWRSAPMRCGAAKSRPGQKRSGRRRRPDRHRRRDLRQGARRAR